MPLEGHWARQQTPFLPKARRELRVFLIAGALTLALVALACWAVLAGTQSAPSPGCTHETIASTTGGATIEHCPR